MGKEALSGSLSVGMRKEGTNFCAEVISRDDKKGERCY